MSGLGICTIMAVGSIPGYRDVIKTFDVEVTKATMSSLGWSGYVENAIDYGETPVPTQPYGLPRGVTFRYSTSTLDICTVNPATGEATIASDGDCVVTVTASAAKYQDATADVTLTVNPLTMTSLVWNGYSPNSVVFGSGTPARGQPSGGPAGVTFSYISLDENVCTVDRVTGGFTSVLDDGSCRVSLVASAIGYSDRTITTTVTIVSKTFQGIAWSGYSADMVTLPDVPNLMEPTGVPSGASVGYGVLDETVCTVDARSGSLTLKREGTCGVTLTVSQTGYSDYVRTFSIAVMAGQTGTVAWSGYSDSSVLMQRGFGYRSDASYGYSTSTPDVCSVGKRES